MSSSPSERESIESAASPRRSASILARLAAALVGIAGATVLLGWSLHIAPLGGAAAGLIRMSPLTALTFVLATATLWVGAVSPDRRITSHLGRASRPQWFRIGGATVALIGLYGFATISSAGISASINSD